MKRYDAAADFACIELLYRLLFLAVTIIISVINELRRSPIANLNKSVEEQE
jgi:hypothetical protein